MPRDMRWKQLMPHFRRDLRGVSRRVVQNGDGGQRDADSLFRAHGAGCAVSLGDRPALRHEPADGELRPARAGAAGVLYLETGAGRSRPVRLTQAGEALCRERVAPIAAAEESIWNGWTEEDRSAYLRLSRQYLEDLRVRVEALTDLQHGGKP